MIAIKYKIQHLVKIEIKQSVHDFLACKKEFFVSPGELLFTKWKLRNRSYYVYQAYNWTVQLNGTIYQAWYINVVCKKYKLDEKFSIWTSHMIYLKAELLEC